jgi:hypothetical protein
MQPLQQPHLGFRRGPALNPWVLGLLAPPTVVKFNNTQLCSWYSSAASNGSYMSVQLVQGWELSGS